MMNTRWMMVMVALLVLLVGCTGNTVSVTRQSQVETAASGYVPGGTPPQNQKQTVINSANGKLPGFGDLNMPGSVQVPAAPITLPPVPTKPTEPQEISEALDNRLTDIEARIEELRVWMMRATIKAAVEPPE